ncbi:MAG: DUF6672 family protein [Rectinema sp.]
MNDTITAKNVPQSKKRRRLVQGGLLVVYILIMVLMVLTGRRHTILIDNKDAPDGSYSAIDGMEVSIDNQESAEYYPGDRDKALVQGQRHTIQVTIFDDNTTIEQEFTVPLWSDMMIISVPKLVAGIEPWIEPFTMAEQIQEAQESGPPSGEMSFQSLGGVAPEEIELMQPSP